MSCLIIMQMSCLIIMQKYQANYKYKFMIYMLILKKSNFKGVYENENCKI
jgi:hypothetical protein